MNLHPWDLSLQEASRLQVELRSRLVPNWDGRAVHSVAGVDVSLQPEFARAAIVVLTFPDLEPVEVALAEAPLVFPYISGYLAFREGPAVLAAWEKLQASPDLVMFDGQGIAHPRGLGIAAHMGLWLDRPTIGVAKSRLIGQHEEVGPAPGDRVPLMDKHNLVIGSVLRTKTKANPLYISPGHLIDVEHAVAFVRACSKGYRLPEPTRWAHNVAGGASLPDAEQPKLF